jgi:hypothetical protein
LLAFCPQNVAGKDRMKNRAKVTAPAFYAIYRHNAGAMDFHN